MVQSSTFARGGRASDLGGTPFFSQEWLANLATAVTLICPNFFGTPLDHSYTWPFDTFQNYNEQAVFFGLTPLVLAAGALFSGTRSRSLWIISALALFCLGVAWHLPGLEAVNHLPVWSMAPGKRLRLPFVFLAAVMAGFGYDRVQSGLFRDRASRYAGGGIILATFLLYVGVFSVKALDESALSPGTFGIRSSIRSLPASNGERTSPSSLLRPSPSAISFLCG